MSILYSYFSYLSGWKEEDKPIIKTEDKSIKTEDKSIKTEDKSIKTEDKSTKPEDKSIKTEDDSRKPVVKKFLISPDDLLKINLNSTNDIIPGPSRNMPVIDTFELSTFNKAQLEEILNIKLRPTIVNVKPTYYPPKNPVIRQMNEKFGIGVLST
jgi:hypothetical protein